MAQRDQVGCFLCGHHTGDPRHTKHVALIKTARFDQVEGRLLHVDLAASHCDSLGVVLSADIDHTGLTRFVNVAESS